MNTSQENGNYTGASIMWCGVMEYTQGPPVLNFGYGDYTVASTTQDKSTGAGQKPLINNSELWELRRSLQYTT